MTELRENARYIFWPGALAFDGPKIMFLHDENEELLVEKSSCILCAFVFLVSALFFDSINRVVSTNKYRSGYSLESIVIVVYYIVYWRTESLGLRSDSEVFLLKMSGCIVFYFSYIPAWIIVF